MSKTTSQKNLHAEAKIHQIKNCSVCVHGHDLDHIEGSMVVCGPQHHAHVASYCCTGFRRVTAIELDERKAAKFGLQDPSSNSETNIQICPRCGRSDAMVEHSPGKFVCHHTHRI